MAEFVSAREELREAELDLMLQRERVAELRRKLPPGPTIPDYRFEGADGAVRLHELFSAPDRPLVLYHFMFGRAHGDACPMCAMWADAWAAVIDHISERVDFAVVTAAPIDATLELARNRGWESLRWLSASDSSFKLDIGGEDEAGNQSPFLSAYELSDDEPRLTYSGGAHIRDEHWRGIDLLSPVWHIFDLTRAGRGDWIPSDGETHG